MAIFICGASVMTSCTSDRSDNPSQEQAKRNRKEFIEHTRSALKELAENMNFKAIPNLNRFLINFNNQVMLNDMDGTMRPWLSGDFTTSLKIYLCQQYRSRQDCAQPRFRQIYQENGWS